MGTVRSRLWREGTLSEEDFDFERISDHLDEDGALVWVDLCDPDPAKLYELAEELSLDPLAVEDALAKAERAKVIRYENYSFLTMYATWFSGEADARRLAVSRISAFVLHRGIVTVRTTSEFDMDEVVRRWDDNADLLKYGVGALLHGLLDVVVDGHFETVEDLDDNIEALEDGLFDEAAPDRDIQRRTYALRKDLVQLRRVVLPMREVVNAVLRHRKDFSAPTELDAWYDDLYDHVLRAAEWTESLRDMIATIFETNLSLQDARLNTVMKQLTGWAAIIAVPTAITGYFGQNVLFPGFGHHAAFVFSTGLIIVLAVVLFVVFRRRDWL
jgi:magnesium transporter